MHEHASLNALATDVISLAKACGASIITAESCTAGALSTLLGTTPGAGDVLHGGLVTYSKPCKSVLLGLSPDMTAASSVTPQVARAMAEGALQACGCADTAIAVTCVAGPGPDPDGNPAGLAHIALADREGTRLDRALKLEPQPGGQVRGEVVKACLELLLDGLGRRNKAAGPPITQHTLE